MSFGRRRLPSSEWGARHMGCVPAHRRAGLEPACTCAGACSARGDFAAMYSELSARERARIRRGAFTAAYQRALDTATATRVVTGRPERDGDGYRIPVRVRTRVWGTVRGAVRVPVSDDGVDWSHDLV